MATGNRQPAGITAIPLVTKGMAQADTSNVDMNYFLGIRQSDGVIAADFEDAATGLNHPAAGVTPIPANGEWHHVAATYDGGTWRIYVDGNLDGQTVVGAFTPRADSIQHAAIGTALGSGGTLPSGQTQGFFNGVMDEIRIWAGARNSFTYTVSDGQAGPTRRRSRSRSTRPTTRPSPTTTPSRPTRTVAARRNVLANDSDGGRRGLTATVGRPR